MKKKERIADIYSLLNNKSLLRNASAKEIKSLHRAIRAINNAQFVKKVLPHLSNAMNQICKRSRFLGGEKTLQEYVPFITDSKWSDECVPSKWSDERIDAILKN